jgi:hypothetical protein
LILTSDFRRGAPGFPPAVAGMLARRLVGCKVAGWHVAGWHVADFNLQPSTRQPSTHSSAAFYFRLPHGGRPIPEIRG